MAEIIPITFALYGFVKAQEPIMQAAFAHADKWSTPWVFTEILQEARVIIADLASENDYEELVNLKRRLPNAEIVALSPKKPPQAKWHLQRQPNGRVSIVGFSQLVLKISHSLKKNLPDVSLSEPELDVEPSVPPTEPGLAAVAVESAETADTGDSGQEPDETGVLSFFNQLDSLLDSKPEVKRKRFNES